MEVPQTDALKLIKKVNSLQSIKMRNDFLVRGDFENKRLKVATQYIVGVGE